MTRNKGESRKTTLVCEDAGRQVTQRLPSSHHPSCQSHGGPRGPITGGVPGPSTCRNTHPKFTLNIYIYIFLERQLIQRGVKLKTCKSEYLYNHLRSDSLEKRGLLQSVKGFRGRLIHMSSRTSPGGQARLTEVEG